MALARTAPNARPPPAARVGRRLKALEAPQYGAHSGHHGVEMGPGHRADHKQEGERRATAFSGSSGAPGESRWAAMPEATRRRPPRPVVGAQVRRLPRAARPLAANRARARAPAMTIPPAPSIVSTGVWPMDRSAFMRLGPVRPHGSHANAGDGESASPSLGRAPSSKPTRSSAPACPAPSPTPRTCAWCRSSPPQVRCAPALSRPRSAGAGPPSPPRGRAHARRPARGGAAGALVLVARERGAPRPATSPPRRRLPNLAP